MEVREKGREEQVGEEGEWKEIMSGRDRGTERGVERGTYESGRGVGGERGSKWEKIERGRGTVKCAIHHYLTMAKASFCSPRRSRGERVWLLRAGVRLENSSEE